jgi:hypothetical protein
MKWHRASIARAKSAETERDKVYLRSFESDMTWNDMVQRGVAWTAALFISPLSTFCNHDGCLLAVPGSGKSTAWDTDHFTPAAAEFLIESNHPSFLGHWTLCECRPPYPVACRGDSGYAMGAVAL